ncbi:DUF86 domain-containing protein [Candidatus Pacearchaeota archaeon]|nr:DUF86 domain-containing protein [Candidatus Pacearchaeota archaeon]
MKSKKIDENKVLSKIDQINSYLEEIEVIKPIDIEEYKNSIEKKRAIERLLQISVEAVIDICYIIVSGLKLGVPSDEDVLFEKLAEKKIISNKLTNTLKEMKGLRNILVHKYAHVKDERVYENLDNLEDFNVFKEEILRFINKVNVH